MGHMLAQWLVEIINSFIIYFCLIPQIQIPGHTEAHMVGRVYVLDTFLSTGAHPSVWLEQLPPPDVRFHQCLFLLPHLATMHLPLCNFSPLHGLLQLLRMCNGTPAGHDAPLHSNLLEPSGPSEGQLSPGPGLSAQGEEAGLLSGSGSHFVCQLLDSSAPDELSAAVPWPTGCHPGGALYRQVTLHPLPP